MYAHFHFSSSPRVRALGQYIQREGALGDRAVHMVAVEALEPVYAEGRQIDPKGTILHVRESALYASVRTKRGSSMRLEWHGKPDLSEVPWVDGPELDLTALRRERRRVAREFRMRMHAPQQWVDA